MSEGEQTYGSISLIGRGAPAPGAVRLDRDKISWKKTGGGRSVDVGADEIEAMTYAQVPGGVVVTVRRRGDKDAVRLKGFRGSDLAGLKDLCSAFYGVSLAKTEAQINGRNWGEVSVNKSAIGFAVDGKDAFEVATKDIAAVSLATKHEVVMEFHLDDVAQQSSKDALVEMSFYVPPTSNEWGVVARTEDSNVNEDEDERTGAKNLQDAILAVADVAADTGTPIAEFESVSLVAPRGKVAVELHAQFMRLTGAAADFKINYAALQRVFLLPKPNSAQTYAVMHLDPPIRKGQTFYAHIVAQFNQNEELEIEPDADEETRAKFPNLEDGVYEGPSGDVFVRLLKAVGGCKLTRQGTFTAADGGHAVKAANKAEVGHLFPLEKSFFYLPKPSTLLHYADVESVEFERHSGPHAAATQRTFDVAVSMRAGATHTFHGIPKSEFQNLVNFLTAKHLKISNVDANARADALIDDDDDDEDHHAQRLRSEVDEDGHGGSDSEEDEDFAAGSESDSGGEPTDESESDSDGDDGSDGSDDEAPAAKKAKKAKTAQKAKKAPAKKAKKDPNAPKRPLSSYMIFAGEARASVVAENPGASIGEVGKALGARWKAFSAEEKAPFEAKAKEAKEKYQEAMKAYEAE